ncbi:hypothetical protein A6A04_09855 [Paramagnetospirillum marisnigri]|uniref:Addiction module toxin RelE n=1 Tax=Paramagnetospirillum marisnigri TaxID=1285242 RepID=A0A178M624_9PROT|nr:type II toxin-antitoxin system RelE/ParE family toxin [Paramagnetospirillum marisnigri]OAN42995.1 hypothetical protein A6A04_09855 [Paramagnetospirillum marisnigri]
MPEVVFGPAARVEIAEAAAWYEARRAGLGEAFVAEIDHIVGRMKSNSRQFPVLHRGIRRALLRHFPYGLFFLIHPDVIHVLACFHSSRDPRGWRERG